MESKINIGEITLSEYNLIMKTLATGQLGECIDLYMRLRQIGIEFQQSQASQQRSNEELPPAA